MARLKDVYGSCKKEMKDTLERADIVAVVRGKPGYANLNQLNVGSPGSDGSDLDDTTDLEELLAQGSIRGPQTHPGTIRRKGRRESAVAYKQWRALTVTGCLYGGQASSAARSSRSQASSSWCVCVHACMRSSSFRWSRPVALMMPWKARVYGVDGVLIAYAGRRLVVVQIIIGSIVSSNSLYIKVKPPHGKKKSALATSIFLAAFLYLCVFGTSVMYFLRARRAQKVYQLSLDVHAD
ncbi:hypothetical protein PybrP1_011652 [[Pythium] brassicae (nom. inval.)]|nr:hypothetical protein PybrP1_011652 [[Pythium] brassicae (nom. inval.)]